MRQQRQTAGLPRSPVQAFGQGGVVDGDVSAFGAGRPVRLGSLGDEVSRIDEDRAAVHEAPSTSQKKDPERGPGLAATPSIAGSSRADQTPLSGPSPAADIQIVPGPAVRSSHPRRPAVDEEAMATDLGEEGSLVLEQRFAIVPEWIIDAEISDCAYRLYSVLLRYGQRSGQRMPGRATLARRLQKSTKDTVDRGLKELVGIGAVVVERRRRGRQNLTNRYHLMSTPPSARRQAVPCTPGRKNQATPGRIRAATLAAKMRPDPVVPTERTPPPSPPSATPAGGGGDAAARTAARGRAPRCWPPAASRTSTRLPRPVSVASSPRVLADLMVRAPAGRGAARGGRRTGLVGEGGRPALLALAADPATQGPMRLACPGPRWDQVRGGRRPRHGEPRRRRGRGTPRSGDPARGSGRPARLGPATGPGRPRRPAPARDAADRRPACLRAACAAEYAPC